jgi:hypothetical protein
MEVPVRALSGVFLVALLVPALEVQPAHAQAAGSRDGGASEVLQSIYIPPLLNAPFMATVHTQWIKPLPEGGTFTLVNERRIARDSRGRIYEERWLLVPKDGAIKSRMNVIQIADPNGHTLYNCFTLKQPRRCTLETFAEPAMAAYNPKAVAAGPMPGNAGFRTHEELGTRTLAGVETAGTKDTSTINAGVYGNDRPFLVTREFWFAASLGINILSEVTDPSFGKEIFTVTDVSLSEPDPSLYELPEGFEVTDHRKTAPPQE